MGIAHRSKQLCLIFVLVLFSIAYFPPGTKGEMPKILSAKESSIAITPGYTGIQEMINSAQPNTTLTISPGIYTEILTINTPLHLQGEGPGETILRLASAPNEYAIVILAQGVTLSNLTIINQGPGLYTAGVKVKAANTTIHDCIFTDTPIGIALWNSNTTISGCTFINCDDEGVALLGTTTSGCTNTNITSCVFQTNCDGIELQRATNTRVPNCSFTNNTHAGIDAIESDNHNTTISFCTFTDNQAFGVYISRSSHTKISQCSFSDDALTFVQASDSTLFIKAKLHRFLLRNNPPLS